MKAEIDRSKVVLLPHINTCFLVTAALSISPLLSLTPWAPSCFSPHCHPIASNCHTQMHTLMSSAPTDTHHVAILHALFHMFFYFQVPCDHSFTRCFHVVVFLPRPSSLPSLSFKMVTTEMPSK